jgi:hypothetical protein
MQRTELPVERIDKDIHRTDSRANKKGEQARLFEFDSAASTAF